MTYRYTVWDYEIQIIRPRFACDFDEDGNPVVGMSFKDAKKALVEQLRNRAKAVKEENETDYLLRKGYV